MCCKKMVENVNGWVDVQLFYILRKKNCRKVKKKRFDHLLLATWFDAGDIKKRPRKFDGRMSNNFLLYISNCDIPLLF